MSKFIKTTYLNKKQTNNGKEKVIMVVKDKDGNKKFKEIVDPPMHYYVTKPEYWLSPGTYVSSMPKDQVKVVPCRHKDIISSIVKEAGSAEDKAELNRIYKQGNYQDFRRLKDFHYKLNNVHGSDINIEDYHINQFIEQSEDNKDIGLDIVFFDIEVDGTQTTGFPEATEAECEINIITLTDWTRKKTISYCLKYDNSEYKSAMEDKSRLFSDLDNLYNNKDGELGLDLGMEFLIYEFDTEMELINAFLNYINEEAKPDICTAWNIGFDFVTIFERIKKNGYDPADFFCPEEMTDKKAYYRLDRLASDVSEDSSVFETNSYTNWIDQLALYANINKPNGKLESVKLNDIGEKEVGIQKDEYEGSIKDLHFRDYYTFILYNIKDTVLTALIENATNMFDLLFSIVDMTRTRPNKALKKTICLRNRSSVFFENQGYVLSNNHAKLLADPNADKIRGGFVANMMLTSRMGDILVRGFNGKDDIRSNRLFSNVCDFDLSSLYPSIIRTFNINPEGHIGKIKLLDTSTIKVPKYEEDKENYDYNTEFVSKLNSQNGVEFSNQFLGLPDLDTASDDIIERIG